MIETRHMLETRSLVFPTVKSDKYEWIFSSISFRSVSDFTCQPLEIIVISVGQQSKRH